MMLNSLSLFNFRNYKKLKIELGQINILVGKNASGKTNLLEAIYFLSYASAFRLHDQRNLINKKATVSRIEAYINSIDRKIEVSVSFELKDEFIPVTKIKLNKVIQKVSQFAGIIKTVSFLPSDLSLISAAPSFKRWYFNNLLIQIQPLYYQNLLHFKKVIDNRNKLLEQIKNKKAKHRELLFWNKELINYSIFIFINRQKVINFINQIITPIYQRLTQTNDKLVIQYQSFLPKLEKLEKSKMFKIYQNELTKLQNKEIEAGFSLLGPHRDNFTFKINEDDLTSFGSRGEFREAILALKLAEGKLIEKVTGEKPILILDDITSELDQDRNNFLFRFLKNYIADKGQIFITVTSLESIDEKFLQEGKIFKIEKDEACLSK
jgi:DNA replication and repair protein RecF